MDTGITTLRPTKTVGLEYRRGAWDGSLDRDLYKRSQSASGSQSSSSAEATSAGSGCVTCTGTPACPVCADDEQCALSLLRCDQCPQTYCAKKSGSLVSSSGSSSAASATSSSSSSKSQNNSGKIGGIVGGVVGGIAVIVVLLLIYLYSKYWRKNRARNKDVLVAHEEFGEDYGDEDNGPSGMDGSGAGGFPDSNRDSRGLYQARNRSSAATQMTKASNILPIAYIPGVTAGSRSKNKLPSLPRHLLRNGDTRSHITLGSSILGGVDDDNDLDLEPPASANTSIPGEESIYSEKNNGNGSQDALTTAIRARPKLVQISEEDDEEEEKHDSQDGETEKRNHSGAEQVFEHDDEKETWVASAVMPSSGESSRQDESHDHEEDMHSDDDGSFIFDVGMEESIRNV
ncbi:LANO_0G11100g1_1 [Lachancea nothofagi CBS 11611]|uniref:LANO_0G11100g1_1 n=1 Tax=Lachancea nothofagi CBS 11611 TaxID=1266666 RepID=A0A1G4KJ45_9SACH|nr:LANO_0G11100g1_1 [Lachancea nothofagi CBS 11611]